MLRVCAITVLYCCCYYFIFIFKIRSDDEKGAEGVVSRRDDVIKKQEELFGVIQRLSCDAARLHETLLLFKTNCDDVSIFHVPQANKKKKKANDRDKFSET